ncbi:MAG: uroporphyrinogen-III synthase, partial [Sphingomonadales bacterium]|nr:uroporphyrinogen-III synthase [Sphingomonadales bacterium]
EAGGFDGLLLTSANALRFGGEGLAALRGLKVYAVGEATAEAAREAGFDVAATGDLGVGRLLGWIEPNLKLLHACGADRHETPGVRQEIAQMTVYRAKAVDDPDLRAAEGNLVLIHSPRAGQRFAELVDDRGTISIAAISAAAAKAVGDGWKAIAVADQPNDDALLALAASLCEKPDPK